MSVTSQSGRGSKKVRKKMVISDQQAIEAVELLLRYCNQRDDSDVCNCPFNKIKDDYCICLIEGAVDLGNIEKAKRRIENAEER